MSGSTSVASRWKKRWNSAKPYQGYSDVPVVWIWVAAYFLVWMTLITLSFVEVYPARPDFDSTLKRWARFDFGHFSDIARFGYFPPPGAASTPAPLYAFFPMYPWGLRLGDALGLPLVVAGLVISFCAGLVATVFLARIAELYSKGLGWRAAAVFVLAPMAIFLYAPYTESLFLAFALPGWYFALRKQWGLAIVLAAASCGVRISGVLLTLALFCLWLQQWRKNRKNPSQRPRKHTFLYFILPTVVVLAWTIYLWINTGDILAYQTAQREYWKREFKFPWDSFVATLTSYTPGPGISLMAWLEIAAGLIGIAVTVMLFIKRRWPEGVFVGINTLLLVTSTYFYSIPRASLLWWPLWIGIAGFLRSRPILFTMYLCASGISMLWWCSLFWRSIWAG